MGMEAASICSCRQWNRNLQLRALSEGSQKYEMSIFADQKNVVCNRHETDLSGLGGAVRSLARNAIVFLAFSMPFNSRIERLVSGLDSAEEIRDFALSREPSAMHRV